MTERLNDRVNVRGLSHTFMTSDGPRTVLKDIDLSIHAGEILAIIGRSGSGKSTLSKCLNLLLTPTSGEISIDGKNITQLSDRELRRARGSIGTIFQASSLIMRRTAAQNIELPLRFAGWSRQTRRERVTTLLDWVGLSEFASYYPWQLSGGQRQRVGIARALALSPRVLLADEATSGLDPETTKSILALLTRLGRELDLAILLITHEMEVVREIATHVAHLENGAIVEQGKVADLIANPASKLGRALLPELRAIEGSAALSRWEVIYGTAEPALDWISVLGERCDARIMLLGGSVESIRGCAAGRFVIGVERTSSDVSAILAGLGLHGRFLGSEKSALSLPEVKNDESVCEKDRVPV